MNHSFEDLFLASVRQFPQNVALSQLRDRWVTMSYRELEATTAKLARFLIGRGFQLGDRIALLSESQMESPVIAVGVLRAGCVLVPLDIKLAAKELSQFLTHSEARLVFTSAAQREKFAEVDALLEKSIPYFPTEEISVPDLRNLKLPTLADATPAIIAYTSGTLGHPKGVVISHGCLVFQMKSCQGVLGIHGNEVCLSLLPMNHLFELVSDVLSGFGIGAEICIASSLEQDHLGRCLHHRRVTHICVVPLMLRSFMNTVFGRARSAGPMRFFIFQMLLRLAKIIPSMAIRRSMFGKIHHLLGGQVRRLICGGSAIGNRDVLPFYFAMGLPIYEGYGLTETGPTISSNTREEYKWGSVGKPLPGLEVKIQKDVELPGDSEILTRGPQVMLGYYKEDELTRGTMTEGGWLRTGDTGYLDRDGFLFVTGRLKRMIVLESGKKIHAEELEGVFSESDLFKEMCIVGRSVTRGKNVAEEVVAVIVPSETLRANTRGDFAEIYKAVKQEILNLAKGSLADYKLPTLILVDDRELPRTSTLKLKLSEMNKRVEALTAATQPAP